MPIIPIIPEIPPKGMDGWGFSDGSDRLEVRLKDSEGNGGFRKREGRVFGEKKAMRWVGLGYRKDIGMMNE